MPESTQKIRIATEDSYPVPKTQEELRLSQSAENFPAPKEPRLVSMKRYLGNVAARGGRNLVIGLADSLLATDRVITSSIDSIKSGVLRASKFGSKIKEGIVNGTKYVGNKVLERPRAMIKKFQDAQEARANKKEIGLSTQELYKQRVLANFNRAMDLLKEKFPDLYKYFKKTHGSLDLPKNISKTNVTDLTNKFDQIFLGIAPDKNTTTEEFNSNVGINAYLNRLRSDEMDPVTKAQIQGALIQASEGLHRLIVGTNLNIVNEQGEEVKKTVVNGKLVEGNIVNQPVSSSEPAVSESNAGPVVEAPVEPSVPTAEASEYNEAANLAQMQQRIADLQAENESLRQQLQQATPPVPGDLFDGAEQKFNTTQPNESLADQLFSATNREPVTLESNVKKKS